MKCSCDICHGLYNSNTMAVQRYPTETAICPNCMEELDREELDNT